MTNNKPLTESENKTNNENMLAIDAVRDLAKDLLTKAYGLGAKNNNVFCESLPQDLIEAGRLAELSQRVSKALSDLKHEVFIYRSGRNREAVAEPDPYCNGCGELIDSASAGCQSAACVSWEGSL